ncbi:2018_t:CDS:2 [Cetraspora pellucida]|uniref:2018_t:CDS:1 n=1 Tax=Cetraspora pellucida TaxID=1433469 RepID=A0A9N9D091_9GLOM|nr:2018_t:CDS:2 [Cetraspora pellucida]
MTEVATTKKEQRLLIKPTKGLQASEDILGHPSSHRLNEADYQKVKEMSTAGVYSQEILSMLHQSNPDSLAISKTIYNIRNKIQHDNLQGCTLIHALFDKLTEGNFEFYYQYN